MRVMPLVEISWLVFNQLMGPLIILPITYHVMIAIVI